MSKETNLRLRANNLHLKNIFTDNYYVELGNIDIPVIERILRNEKVNVEEVSYFPIQNKGLGKSNQTDEALKKILPYLFFKNVNSKNISKQLFITYGVLKYQNNEKKEVFIPVVLIPIKLYFENDEIFIQMISRPIENPFLLKIFNDNNKNSEYTVERLDNIYDIDKLCMSFEKISEFELKLENYLTFGYLKRNEQIINSSSFQIENDLSDDCFDTMYSSNTANIYYSDLLNRKQRKAVIASTIGESFTITGYGGTGKTTTLKNIVVNAINQEKRILYLSNMKETLDDVEAFMNKIGLGRNIANFSNSFSSLADEKYQSFEKEESPLMTYDVLQENYDYINGFENKMSGRILDFRYIDALNELSKLSLINPKELDIDDLSNIYKHEFKEIVDKLISIRDSLEKIDSFKNNIWKEIPIINNIMYPDQIIGLIRRILNCFVTFEEEKKKLENKFSIKEIDNYAMIKNIIYNIENLNIEYVPESWKQVDIKKYIKAKDEYKNLKNDVYSYQEADYYLNHKFVNIDTISVKNELESLLGNYYTKDNISDINELLSNRTNITARINRGLYQKENYEKSVKTIKEFANWDFHLQNESLKEMIKLSDFLSSHNVVRRWIHVVNNNQYQKVYPQLEECVENIERLTKDIADFNEKYPKISNNNLKELVDIINEYNSLAVENKNEQNRISTNLKKKLGSNDIDLLVHKIKIHFDNIRSLKQEKDEYYDLVREKYDPEALACENLKAWNDYLTSINNKNIYTNIVKLLTKISEKDNNIKEDNHKIIKALHTLRKACYELDDLSKILSGYKIKFKETVFDKKVIEIEKAVEFVRGLYSSNDRMKNIVKVKDNYYVNAEMYFLLDSNLDKKYEIRNRLNNNAEYQELYGKLYHGEKTDITLISRLLQNFQLYYDCFKPGNGFIKVLEKETYDDICEHLNTCQKVSDEINEIFKIYCRIFKDGVSRYYYTSIEDNIVYLNSLLNAKDELLVYLTITKGIMVLNKYKLNKLINYIINIKDTTFLVENFKYTYFKNVEKMYLEIHPELADTNAFLDKLKETISLEKMYMSKVENEVLNHINHISGKAYFGGIKNLDYHGFVRKTKGYKHLFLSTTDIANLYLDKDSFDLIIIDDAHLFSANEYGDFIYGNQVIIAGEYQFHASISNSLISQTRNTSTIVLDYRYLPIPKILLNYSEDLNGIIKQEYSKNIGLEIVEDGMIEYLFNLYQKDKSLKINYFTRGLRKQRELFEAITSYFYDNGVERKEIFEYLTKNINISDLREGYLFNSNYNIVDFEDYYDINVDYISDNMLDFLLICDTKLVIYDHSSLLGNNNDNYRFYASLEKLLNSRSNTFSHIHTNDSLDIFIKLLEDEDTLCYGDKYNIIYKVMPDDKVKALMVLWGRDSTSETMNVYRDVYSNYLKNGWDIQLIMKNELSKDMEKKALKIKENF